MKKSQHFWSAFRKESVCGDCLLMTHPEPSSLNLGRQVYGVFERKSFVVFLQCISQIGSASLLKISENKSFSFPEWVYSRFIPPFNKLPKPEIQDQRSLSRMRCRHLAELERVLIGHRGRRILRCCSKFTLYKSIT